MRMYVGVKWNPLVTSHQCSQLQTAVEGEEQTKAQGERKEDGLIKVAKKGARKQSKVDVAVTCRFFVQHCKGHENIWFDSFDGTL